MPSFCPHSFAYSQVLQQILAQSLKRLFAQKQLP